MLQRLLIAFTLSMIAFTVLATDAPAETRPFRDAVRAGDFLFISGQIGIAPPGTDALAGGMEIAATRAMNRIGDILRAEHRTFDDVVKCLVMLDDMKNWENFNAVYVRFFRPGRLPARSALAAKALAFDALVEVECTAYVGPSK
jgi:reactive intermediate/imine deaminase